MAGFRSEVLEDLTRQLTFVPPNRRRQDIDRAEQLYWEIDPDRNYPLEFIIYRITSYRPDTTPAATFVGSAIRADLLVLVERLSESLEERVADHDPSPLDIAAVCRRFNVSGKTISRYRREGLFARRMIDATGRKRLVFLPSSVARFEQTRGQKVRSAAKFSRFSDEERHAMIVRARRIASRTGASPYQVARHLARKYGRSIEAVRRMLVAHDRRDPRVAIFRNHTPPLTEAQQREMYRAYLAGEAVAAIARRFRRERTAVYRAINLCRAASLEAMDLSYIANPTFEHPDAEEVILGPGGSQDEPEELPAATKAADAAPGDGVGAYVLELYGQPVLDEETEQSLFVRYNYLKYRAATMRAALNPTQPASSHLDRIETYLRRAARVKQRLVKANLRLVVSVARKHLSGRPGKEAIGELIAEGNLVLVEVIDTYDVTRGNRFSTYLTWSLMRRFAQDRTDRRALSLEAVEQFRGEVGPVELNPALALVEQTEDISATLHRLMSKLDERERYIIASHFGLADTGGARREPQTLTELGRELGISDERVRHIEHRALVKLREAAADMGLNLPPMP